MRKFLYAEGEFGWPWIVPLSLSTKSDCASLVSTVIYAEEATLYNLRQNLDLSELQ